MQLGRRQLLVLGDRVLIEPESAQERTRVGLYLPQTVVDKEPVMSGRIVEVGPGLALPNLAADVPDEPWKEQRTAPPIRWIPPMVEIGDWVLFLKRDAVEIRFEGKNFLVAPQGAILLAVRDDPAEMD